MFQSLLLYFPLCVWLRYDFLGKLFFVNVNVDQMFEIRILTIVCYMLSQNLQKEVAVYDRYFQETKRTLRYPLRIVRQKEQGKRWPGLRGLVPKVQMRRETDLLIRTMSSFFSYSEFSLVGWLLSFGKCKKERGKDSRI